MGFFFFNQGLITEALSSAVFQPQRINSTARGSPKPSDSPTAPPPPKAEAKQRDRHRRHLPSSGLLPSLPREQKGGGFPASSPEISGDLRHLLGPVSAAPGPPARSRRCLRYFGPSLEGTGRNRPAPRAWLKLQRPFGPFVLNQGAMAALQGLHPPLPEAGMARSTC